MISRVLYEKCNQVAYITLNRPEKLNAMDEQMHKELAVIWDDFEQDANIRVGVLRGAGSQAFSVGKDLNELAQQQKDGTASESSFGSSGAAGWPRLTERFDRVKPLIAQVHGYALGGGFELALACDIILAADNAQFALPEARLGLIAGAGGLFRLTRQIPSRTALGYLLTGRSMTAQRAFELGLINEVVAIDKMDDCVNSWVHDILRCAPLSVQAIMEVVAKSMTLPLDQAFAANYSWETVRKQSMDAKEGPRAFSEKRDPVWKGQ